MDIDLSKICILSTDTIRRAISCIDCNPAKIALVVDDKLRLMDTITDGDVRRGILANLDLDQPVTMLWDQKKATERRADPVVASADAGEPALLQLMQHHQIRQVPLVDQQNRVVGLVRLQDLLPTDPQLVDAVVMVGGRGTRLNPLTNDTPKPMLPVGERPLLENIIKKLRDAGIEQVNLATNFREEVVAQHFGDGTNFGVNIRYIRESQPLGTAGALGLMEVSDKPLLVINGDILTQVNFRDMIDFHRDHKAEMTVGVRQYEFSIPYGVVETDGISIIGISEKPLVRHFINAGIYLLNPTVRRFVPPGEHYDMPDLILRLVSEGLPVISFPVREYWLDIGRPEDYQQALADIHKTEFGLAS